MTTLTLGGFSGRLRAIGRAGAATGRRFRGKKVAVAALLRKRQVVDFVAARLVDEVVDVQGQWAGIQPHIAAAELDRLALILSRARLLQQSVARTFAGLETQSIVGLNACDADIQSAVSLLARLRLEVRVSAARAARVGVV
jgi:hypothetical protein